MAQGRRPPKIPRHIIFFHILPRLPVSSLQRCRSVCKQWLKFLKTRFFANMHNHHLTNGSTVQLQPSLLFLSTEKPFEFKIIDFEAPDDGSIPRRHYFPFVPADTYSIRALTSLHGLVVCLIIYRDRDSYKDRDIDLILWNPLTGGHKTLCKPNPYLKLCILKHQMSSGLYYNAADDDYKLLILSSYDLGVRIYSLKSDSWRNVDTTDNYQTLSHYKPTQPFWEWRLSNGIWLNGNLYFLYDGDKDLIYFFCNTDRRDRKRISLIIKFDTKIEKFIVIPTHPSLMYLDVKNLSMSVEKGVIHLGVKYETRRHVYSTNAYIQLWRMIGDHGKWEKVGGQYRVDNLLKPLHWIGDKTWLMMENKNIRDMYKVDHNKGTCIISKYMTAREYMSETVKYTESFMSVDR